MLVYSLFHLSNLHTVLPLAFDLMIMVRRVIYLIVAAAVIAGCTCREDIRADLPGKVMFSFVLECDGNTKAVKGDVISDFNLYVFNTAGDVVSSGFFTGGEEASLDIWCGESCSVYVVANAGRRIMVCSNPLQYSCLENPMDGGAW